MRYTSILLILLWIRVSQAFVQVPSEYNSPGYFCGKLFRWWLHRIFRSITYERGRFRLLRLVHFRCKRNYRRSSYL